MHPFLSKLSLGALMIIFNLFFGFKSSCNDLIHKGGANIIYIYPKENQVIYYHDLILRWQNKENKGCQRLQLSIVKDFSEIFIDTILQGYSFPIKDLEKNKEFYWRITDASTDIINPYSADYSFFKTTSLHLQYPENNFGLNLIPTYAGDQQLLFIDNPHLLKYSLSILSIEDKSRIFDRQTCSSNQCIPTYKLPKGKYILKIHFTEKEINSISEVLLTQDE